MSEDRLDRAVNEVRNESVPAEEMAAAKTRVWERLSGAEPALCREFREALPAYLAGGLKPDRRLLVEDHLGRCARCRRALAERRGESAVVPMPAPRRRALPAWTRWAMAAGVAALAVYLGRGPMDRALAPSGPRATVVSLSGVLSRVSEGPLSTGATLSDGEVVRTSLGGRATLRLDDGSLLEMNERTELAVTSTFSRRSIRLERGDVVVQAAPQGFRRLQVVTRDSLATVKGTVFAVSAGMAGSVVSVVEGSVQVRQPRGERLLRRGQLAASSPALDGVSVERTLSWSENAEKYYALLGELAQIEKTVAATAAQNFRTQASLLAYLPANPVLYVAVPNLGPTVEHAVSLIEQRAQESAVLREWWTSSQTERLRQMVSRMQTVSPLLGEEIAFVFFTPPLSSAAVPVVLAEVKPGQQDALRQALVKVVPPEGPAYQVDHRLLVLSDSALHLGQALANLGGGAASPFAAEIASHYQGGVGLVVAGDAAAAKPRTVAPGAEVLGAAQVKYLLFEQRAAANGEELRASVVFNGPRTGIASWLATPGPAGSAEYVSADAVLAVSASTKNPREAFDEFVALAGRVDPKFRQSLAEVESLTGVSMANDIAAALGSDFTFAVERPSIPVPGWFAALEVKQPGAIDAAVRRFADSINQKLAADGQPGAIQVAEETAGGRNWMKVTMAGGGIPLYWTYDRGYMVASTDRDLALQAINTRNGGFPLIRSQKFLDQLPASSVLHQSAFLWLNTQGALADAAKLMNSGSLKSLLANREPLLVVCLADRERIQASSRSRLMDLVFSAMLAGGQERQRQPERQAAVADATRN